MTTTITGVASAIAKGAAITSANPVDGEAVTAASNNTAIQSLSDYIKSIVQHFLDDTSIQTVNGLKGFLDGLQGLSPSANVPGLYGTGNTNAAGCEAFGDASSATGLGLLGRIWKSGGGITAGALALKAFVGQSAAPGTPDTTIADVIGGIWGALKFFGANPTGTTAIHNSITPGLLVKAMATFILNGAGAITPEVSQNVTSITAVAGGTGYVRVVVAQDFAATGGTFKAFAVPAWVALPSTPGLRLVGSMVDATTFDITLWNGGTQVDPTLTSYEVGFLAIGFQ